MQDLVKEPNAAARTPPSWDELKPPHCDTVRAAAKESEMSANAVEDMEEMHCCDKPAAAVPVTSASWWWQNRGGVSQRVLRPPRSPSLHAPARW